MTQFLNISPQTTLKAPPVLDSSIPPADVEVSADQTSVDSSTPPSLKALFRELGITDERGMIVNAEKLPKFPTLKSLDRSIIDKTLKKDVTIQVGKNSFEISLSDLLTHIYYKNLANISNIEIIGGFVRKVLLESPDFLMEILIALTDLPPEKLQPYVDDLVKKSKARDLPDIDIRIHSNSCGRDILCNFTESVVEHFSNCSQNNREFVKQNAFEKFKVVFDTHNKLSMATVKPLDNCAFELLFVALLKRNHLFIHDSLRLSILPYILGVGSLALETDFKTPWQPTIDLITQVIHIHELETVDNNGFAALMYYFSKGRSAPIRSDVLQLGKKITQSLQNSAKIPDIVRGFLSTTLENHDPEDKLLAIALTINTLMYLEISPEDSNDIWQQMRTQFWKDVDLTGFPFLKAIDDAITVQQIPISKLAALIKLYNQEDSPVKIPGTSYYLNPSCTTTDTIDILADYAHTPSEIDWLFTFLIEQSPSLPSEVIEKSFKLSSSKDRAQRFLGFMLLLNCEDQKAHPVLLKQFINVLNYTPEIHRPTLIDRLQKSPPFDQLMSKFNVKDSDLKQMSHWITILTEQEDTLTIAHSLWMRHREKFKKESQAKLDAILVKELLALDLGKALELIELGALGKKSIEVEKTIEMLTLALPYVTKLDDGRFAARTPQVAALLMVVLCHIKDDSFVKALAEFIDRLIATAHYKEAEGLLDILGKQPGIPLLYQCRLRLFDLNNKSLSLKRWKRLGAIEKCPKEHQPLYNKLHLALTTQLLKREKTAPEGYTQLRKLAEQFEPDHSLSPLVERDVKELIDSDDTPLAKNLINDVYLKHLTPKALLSLRTCLFNRFLRKKAYNEAYHQWKSIHSADPQTTRTLLDALINNGAQMKQLNAALRLIRKEISDQELPPLDKLNYLIEIFQKNRSLELLGYIVSYALENPTCKSEQVRTIELFNAEIKQKKKFDPSYIGQIENLLPVIIETLKNNYQPSLVEEIAHAINTFGLSLTDFELIRSQAESYLASKTPKKALKWIEKASKQEELFLQWLPDLLNRCHELNPNHEAKLYLDYHKNIQSLPDYSKFAARVDQLASGKQLAVLKAAELLNLYPPKTSSSWDKIIQRCGSKEFPLVWKSFYTWLSTQPEISSDLKATVYAAVERFSDLEESPVPKLFESLGSSNSTLGRLCSNDSEIFEFRGKLLLSYATQAKTPQEFSALYKAIHKNLIVNAHTLAYRDLTLELIGLLDGRKEKSFTSYACEIFSQLTWTVILSSSHLYCDAASQTLITLLDSVLADTELTESDTLTQLTLASYALRGMFSDKMPNLDIADKLSQFNHLGALKECYEYLSSIPKNSSKRERVWGQYLPKWVIFNYDLESPSAVNNAFDYLNDNFDKVEYKSEDYITCSNMTFDLILKCRDRKETLIKSDMYLLLHFAKLFQGRISFPIPNKWPPDPYLSVNINCTDSCSHEDKEFFFDRMSTFISKLLDRNALDTSEESHVRDFITKNLWRLCTNFPHKKKKLVQLLDRLYFRYPPKKSEFFPKHVADAGKLITHAMSQGVYDNDEHKLTEAMFFLETKTCIVKGKRPEDQAAILEDVIDRTLAFQTPDAVVRAIIILLGTQEAVIHNNLESIERIYTKLTDSIMIDPFYFYNGSTLFEWVKLGLMLKETMIGFSANEKAFSTLSTLSENLFSKVFKEIFQQKGKFENNPFFSRLSLLQWLGNFLLLSREHGAFWDNKGAGRYFDLVKMIIPEVIKEYPLISEIKNQNAISEIYTQVISFKKYHDKNILTKQQKNDRSELMSDWLSTLSSTPVIFRNRLNEVKETGKTENNEDFINIEKKIKSY